MKLFLDKRSSVALRNSSHELSATCAHETSILLHNLCRDLAQKLLCFANEHAYCNSLGDGALSRSMRRSDSAKEMPKAVSHVFEESLLLEKSVASFLKEVEKFVSKVDAARTETEIVKLPFSAAMARSGGLRRLLPTSVRKRSKESSACVNGTPIPTACTVPL